MQAIDDGEVGVLIGRPGRAATEVHQSIQFVAGFTVLQFCYIEFRFQRSPPKGLGPVQAWDVPGFQAGQSNMESSQCAHLSPQSLVGHPRCANVTSMLSVIVPWNDRQEFEQTLVWNAARLPKVQWVVVNSGGDGRELRRILQASGVAARVVTLPISQFNKALALNAGVSECDGEHLFFLDTDVTIIGRFVDHAVKRLAKERCYITVARVHESDESLRRPESHVVQHRSIVEFVLKDGRRIRLETGAHDLRAGHRSGPGLVLLRRSDFEAVQGMSSELSGWGWEDNDLLARLQTLDGMAHRRMGTVQHRSHGDIKRWLNGQSRAASEACNYRDCLARYMAGDMTGSLREDRLRWKGRLQVENLA